MLNGIYIYIYLPTIIILNREINPKNIYIYIYIFPIINNTSNMPNIILNGEI